MRMDTKPRCLARAWRFIAAALMLCCICMIFFFSSQDGSESSQLSKQVTATLMQALTHETPDMNASEFAQWHHVIRKLAHATEYALLALSTGLFLHAYPLPAWKRFSFAACFCLVTASLDEFQQTFRSARAGTPVDVCIDMGGALLALMLLFAVFRFAKWYGQNPSSSKADDWTV